MTTYVIGPHGFPQWEKDPSAVKDYSVDWAAWLAGDTISSYTVVVQAGLTKDSDSRNVGVVTVWLSGGVAGKTYSVVNRIVTTNGRTEERTFEILVKNQ